MTCYIYRETTRILIGPFPTADWALNHRDMLREELIGRIGRPRRIDPIVSAEEAINLVLSGRVRRTTPEEDLAAAMGGSDRAA